jgi:hypothetical protein
VGEPAEAGSLKEDQVAATNGQPGDHTTDAVTLAGGFLVALGALFATIPFLVLALVPGGIDRSVAILFAIFLSLALIFSFAGVATMRRWRCWRIWYGSLAWGAIAMVPLSVASVVLVPPTFDPMSDMRQLHALAIDFVILVVAVLALLAKRAERPRV